MLNQRFYEMLSQLCRNILLIEMVELDLSCVDIATVPQRLNGRAMLLLCPDTRVVGRELRCSLKGKRILLRIGCSLHHRRRTESQGLSSYLIFLYYCRRLYNIFYISDNK